MSNTVSKQNRISIESLDRMNQFLLPPAMDVRGTETAHSLRTVWKTVQHMIKRCSVLQTLI